MKVCFVGIGSIAKRHIRNLTKICKERQIELHIDALRRNAVRGDGFPEGIEQIFTSVDELPRDYDIIFLTNPTEHHAETLAHVHDHARHFFIEKPVASLRTLSRLEQIPLRPDSVYYVACPLRYTGVIQYLKNEIDPAAVLAVRSISSSYLPEWRPGTDYRSTYSAHKELGGGVDIDLIHEWDYLTYLFGMPSEVHSFTGKVSQLDIDSNDYAVYIARYGNERICELHLDYFGRKSMRTIALFTDTDTIIGDLLAGTVSWTKSGKVIDFGGERDAYQTRELGFFLDAVTSGDKLQEELPHAVKVLKLTQGILEK